MSKKVAAGPLATVPIFLIVGIVGFKAITSTSPPDLLSTVQHTIGAVTQPHPTIAPARPHPSQAPSPAAPELIAAITSASHIYVGDKLWAKTQWAAETQNGYLGCAASVTYVLWHAGVHISGSDNVLQLVDQLGAAGWKKIEITREDQFRKGDVVYGNNGGTDHHVGIIGATGQTVNVYDNSSADGKWHYHALAAYGGDFVPGHRFKKGHLFVMRYTG